MTKKDLQSYSGIKKEIRQIEGAIRELSAKVYSPRAPQLTGMPGAASTQRGSAQERAATELFELREHYEAKVRELYTRRLQIERAIDELPEELERVILRAHYIDGQTWERTCITASVGWGTVHEWHRKALRELAKNPYTFVQPRMVQ